MTAPTETLASPVEVARYLGITVDALAAQRYRREGPPYIKHGRLVRYRWDAVRAWLDANTVQPSI